MMYTHLSFIVHRPSFIRHQCARVLMYVDKNYGPETRTRTRIRTRKTQAREQDLELELELEMEMERTPAIGPLFQT